MTKIKKWSDIEPGDVLWFQNWNGDWWKFEVISKDWPRRRLEVKTIRKTDTKVRRRKNVTTFLFNVPEFIKEGRIRRRK